MPLSTQLPALRRRVMSLLPPPAANLVPLAQSASGEVRSALIAREALASW